MNPRKLRTPEERVGTLPNGALPPPEEEPPSTESLLHRALIQGDEHALADVVRRLRPEMLRVASRHVRSHDEAEDVVQEAWIAALRGVHRFEGRASLRTWLLRILVYRARSSVRGRHRLVPISQLLPAGATEDGLPDLISPPAGPEELLMERELRGQVETAVAQLPARQGEVVRLRDLEGWSPEEVCDHLDLSPGNQRVLLHRGRSQIRQLVTGTGIGVGVGAA